MPLQSAEHSERFDYPSKARIEHKDTDKLMYRPLSHVLIAQRSHIHGHHWKTKLNRYRRLIITIRNMVIRFRFLLRKIILMSEFLRSYVIEFGSAFFVSKMLLIRESRKYDSTDDG